MGSHHWQANSTFDPYSQTFVITAPDGVTALPAYMQELLMLQNIAVSQGIIYGIQIGLTSLLFVVMMLMTKHDKRKSAVFLLNSLALLLLVIRNILACCELRSVFYNYYNWQLHYYPLGSGLQTAMQVSLTAEIFNFFVDSAIYSSLLLQVHIVCCTVTRFYKLCIIGVSACLALTALGVRLYLAVINIDYSILGVNTLSVEKNEWLSHIASVNNIVTVVTISLFSLIFVTKLAFAIHLRRKLNMKQFGPMQIIFVMGCQTLCVPLIFAVVSYYATVGAQLNSFVPTIVAIFLPLSGMWASSQTGHGNLIRSGHRFHRAIPVGVSDLSSAKAYGTTKTTSDTTDTLIGDDEIDPCTSERLRSAGGQSAEHDVEMQQYKNAVVVDRTYSVRSD